MSQLFELLQRTGLHQLVRTGATADYRHRRCGRTAVGYQALADIRRLHGAHVDSQSLARTRQIGPVQAIAVGATVASNKGNALCVIAVRKRDASIGGCPGGGRYSRHHLEGNARRGGHL
ncbi:hypothetical protein D3C73_1190920 [compost metagenome]